MSYPPSGGTPDPYQPQQPGQQQPYDPTAAYPADPTAPASGQPHYGPPAYGPPGSDQPPYGPPPTSGQLPYGPPSGSRPPSSGGQPPYGPPSGHGQAQYGQAQYGQPYGQPGYGGPTYVPVVATTNTMAILSLVFAFVFAPAAIVLGHVARKQISRTGEQGGGLATAGLWLGYIFTGLMLLYCIGFVAVIIIGAAQGSTS